MSRSSSFGEHTKSSLDELIFSLRLRKILSYIPKDITSIADFGCGFDAQALRYIIQAKKIKRGYGLDISVTKNIVPNIELVVADFENGPSSLVSDSIDCVLSLAVLEHLNTPSAYLADIRRVLKPEGTLILTTPSPAAKPVLEFLAYDLHLIDRTEIDDHKHYFSKGELRETFKQTGFPGKSILVKNFQLGMNIVAICRK